MKRLLLAPLLPLLLAACNQPADPPVAAVATDQAPAQAEEGAGADAAGPSLQDVVAGQWRNPDHAARDQYRHPVETLEFFGIAPEQTVVEVTPGAGWYAEILAPYLRSRGQYIAAVVDPAALEPGRGRDYQQRSRDTIEALFAGDPERYDRTAIVAFDPASPRFGAPASADLVLTFRNVHNWRSNGQADGMFAGFHEVLRPGGVLGVVEHRAAADVAADDASGYVGQDQVVALAEAAGFVLDAASEVNANPDDTRDHPNGVWTLPPGNNHDPADAERYQRIGESDRMTLRFRKPE